MSITREQFNNYLIKVGNRPFFIRHGQALVSELYLMSPEIYKVVVDRVDPFCADDRIPAFLDEVSRYIEG